MKKIMRVDNSGWIKVNSDSEINTSGIWTLVESGQ